MTSSQLLSIVTFVYGAAAFAYLAAWIFKKETPGKIGTGLALAAVLGNLIGILLRWRESYSLGIGHAPLTNLYESLVFFSLTIGLLYLYLERRYKNRVIGAFAMPLASLALAYAGLSPHISNHIEPLIPALKSNWLIAHVIACFIGYAAFGIAFGISIMFFLRQGGRGRNSGLLQRLPSDKILDELTHQLVMFGFLWLTAGIITGAVWANSAWGRYWGWDPKETWSFITWLIYAALLHFRLMRGWRGKRLAVLSVVGFLAVLFTYFGVNLLPGLHSYGALGL
jgi:cytochrome c-type biogenesis protein CcsB